MLIWSGAGIMVPVIVVILLLMTEAVVNALFDDSGFYTAHGWPKLLALWMGAISLWPYGRWLNRDKGRTKEQVDPDTGQRIQVNMGGETHSFFFIPVEYWAVICAVLGIVFLFV